MKVLHVTREWPQDKKYGLGRSLLPLVDGLQQQGVQARYICQQDLGERSLRLLRSANLKLQAVFKRFQSDTEFANLTWGVAERFNMGRLAAKLAAAEGYTHVHLHDPLIAWGFRWFARRGRPKFAWGITEHGFGSYAQAIHEDGALMATATMTRMRSLERRISLAADWVICPTMRALGQLSRDLGVYPRPATWHSIHHPKPGLRLVSRATAREQLGWDSETLYAVAVGRLVPLKRFDLIVEACAHSGLDRLQLVLVGEGNREPLMEKARQCGIGDRVHFAHGEDMSLYYSAPDLYLSASRTESFGLANLEAMAAGLPIIATAVGGVPEVLGDAAHWVPADDVEAMALSIRHVLAAPAYRDELQRRARKRSESWPDVLEVTKQYELVYRTALAKADSGVQRLRHSSGA